MNTPRPGNRYRIEVGGDVSGQFAAGENIHQANVQAPAPAPVTDADLAEVRSLVEEPTADQAGSVFISYRREETQGMAGRLADRLVDRLGDARVFMDVEGIRPGFDFAQEIDQAVSSCSVLLAIIGRRWTTVTDEQGRRRLDDPNDFVLLEIATALRRNILVIPIFVDGAAVPGVSDLPAPIKELARRHGSRVDHETFRSDVDSLLRAVELALTKEASSRGGSIGV
jgi:hypothetical protein